MERNGEREPSREEDRANRREGGRRREGGERRGLGSCACSLRAQQVQLSSAAGTVGETESLSEQTAALRGSDRTTKRSGAARERRPASWPQFAAAHRSAPAAGCSLHGAVTSFSSGKSREPQGGVNFWHNCSALRHLSTSEGM